MVLPPETPEPRLPTEPRDGAPGPGWSDDDWARALDRQDRKSTRLNSSH